MRRCHVVNSLLKSRALLAEGKTLHAILYNFHYQMRHHRPYRSLRQVQQCLKRLHLMNLKQSIEKLSELGSMKQKSENPKESLVPSQPVIEVLLVKILGGCKLLLHLLERCCTAFLILYRGVLKSLSSLYQSLFELLQEVSQSQPRPYIKEFAFPSAINEFLGTAYLEIQKKMPKAFKEKAKKSWISKMFSVSKARKLVRATVPSGVTSKVPKSLDVGQPVQINRTNQDRGTDLVFDVRTLCRYPDPTLLEMNKFQVKHPHLKQRSTSLKFQHLKPFLTKLQQVHSFKQLSDALRTTILWCKSKKLKSQAVYLGMKLLKCRHLQHVEAQGCSLQRKLGCIKATVCRYLRISYSREEPKQRLGAKRLQGQIKLSRNLRCISKKTPPRFEPDWKKTVCSGNTINGSVPFSLAQEFERSSDMRDADKSHSEETAEEQAEALEGKPAHLQKEVSESKDYIDDIFAAIGI